MLLIKLYLSLVPVSVGVDWYCLFQAVVRPSGGHAVVLNWSMYNIYGMHPHEVGTVQAPTHHYTSHDAAFCVIF